MRDLTHDELISVYGAGKPDCWIPPGKDPCFIPPGHRKDKKGCEPEPPDCEPEPPDCEPKPPCY